MEKVTDFVKKKKVLKHELNKLNSCTSHYLDRENDWFSCGVSFHRRVFFFFFLNLTPRRLEKAILRSQQY